MRFIVSVIRRQVQSKIVQNLLKKIGYIERLGEIEKEKFNKTGKWQKIEESNDIQPPKRT